MNNHLVPENFNVPNNFESDIFKLKILSEEYAWVDYLAIINNIDYLQAIKPFGTGNDWPPRDLSFEQDLEDIRYHEEEFRNRKSFAYTVLNKDENKCLGCVYIYPSKNAFYDAVVLMWVIENKNVNLDERLFSIIKKWISEVWPFNNVAYPGREISWQDFNKAA
ncbi:MAG: GNAT family N-acetyltransferase [Candidatus Nanoarchaeia archaeon]